MMSKKKTDSDYEVGYGKPPKEHRFKKGRSGNPKGRTKKKKNMATVMKDLLERPMTIRQNGQERRVTFSEAFVHRLAARSLEGSPRDMIALMKAIHDYMPEAVAKDQLPTEIRVNFVDTDGQGRPADKSSWKDCPPGSYAYESYKQEQEQKERGEVPDTIGTSQEPGEFKHDD